MGELVAFQWGEKILTMQEWFSGESDSTILGPIIGKVFTSLVAHNYCGMKQLRTLLLSPGWNASPSEDYSQRFVRFDQQFAGTNLCTRVERNKVE